MAMPVNATDPDPTSQIPWPSGRNASGVSNTSANDIQAEVISGRQPTKYTGTHQEDAIITTLRPLTKWNLFTLSIGMLGAQVAWTVELGSVTFVPCFWTIPATMFTFVAYRYGTPFLLSLGLSEQLTSLVWLAGPISGLIAQPVIGTS